jgi:ribosome biogenesis ATPase
VEDIANKIQQDRRYKTQKLSNILRVVKEFMSEMKENSKKTSEQGEKVENNSNMLGKKRSLPMTSSSEDKEIEEFLYKPTMKLSDIGGMEEIVDDLKKTIGYPLEFYYIHKYMKIEPVKGILICGPPGCGKTTLAQAIGGEFDIPFYKITAPQIVSSLSGESENKIRKLFNKAVESAPCILFIDEIESIIGRRENAHKDMERRIVAQIMSCIDEISDKQLSLNAPVFIIGATSKPEFIDSSVRRSGRFDKEIHIGQPSESSRLGMLVSMTKDKLVAENVDFGKLARNTPGYLAADLRSLVIKSGHNAIERIIKDIRDNEKIEEEGRKEIELVGYKIEMSDFENAVATIQPTAKREGFATTPNVTWNNIGGLGELRSELYFDIVLPIADPDKLKMVKIDRAVGVLLYGPPGCGKTLLAKAVANEAKSNFISIKGPELLNKYVGESEKAVRDLFRRARDSSPCIIFFDELDALCPKRSMDNNAATERVVNQLLTEMDGLEDRKQVFIIAATNRPDIIDPAMLRPGRLDKLLYVPLPNENERLLIVKACAKGKPFAESINWDVISKNKKLEGFSGADIDALIRESQMHCLKRIIRNQLKDGELIELEDVEYAMSHIMPSVSKSDKEKYEHVSAFFKYLAAKVIEGIEISYYRKLNKNLFRLIPILSNFGIDLQFHRELVIPKRGFHVLLDNL